MCDLEEALKGQRLTYIKSRRYSDSALGRSVRRPEDISRDVRGLKARQRVSLVLQDEILREDLEDMTKAFVRNGGRTPGIRTYQDFLIPTIQPSYNGGAVNGFGGRVFPINDLRGDEALRYPKAERMIRCKLASFYRVVDYFRWSFLVYNHITVRIPGVSDRFLIKPLGLLDGEVTASSLITLDLNSNVTDEGSTSFDVNAAGFYIHSAVYDERPDTKCIAHIHYPSVQAVASMKCGLLRLSQESLALGKISYLDFGGLFVTPEEKEDLKKCFPLDSKVLMMRNHGVLVAADSVEEVFQLLYALVSSCEMQVRMMPVGIENMHILSEDYVEEYAASTNVENVRMGHRLSLTTAQLEWEAMMRTLDGLGYCTAYNYRVPDAFTGNNTKKIPESQVPPSSTSFMSQTRERTPYDLVYEIERGNSVQRSASVSRANTYRNRVKWLNSPVMATQYQKEKDIPPPKQEKEQQVHPSQNGVVEQEASDLADQEERIKPETGDSKTDDLADKTTANSETVVTKTTHSATSGDGQVTSTTNVIKMVTHKTVEVIDGKEVVVDDSHVFINGKSSNGDDFVVVEGDGSFSTPTKLPVEDGTASALSPSAAGGAPSDSGSRSDVSDKHAEPTEKSPKKVKKQKSFKSFMKKVGKK